MTIRRNNDKVMGMNDRYSVVICVVLCIVCRCVLPPGDNPVAVNKYIIS